MYRNAYISLLLLAGLLSCSASDPCGGQSGTCLAISVEGSVALDALNFTLGGAVQASAMRSLPAGGTSLPVQVAVLLPDTAQGAVSISAVATMAGQTVGLGRAVATVTPGAYVQAVLDIQQVNNTCIDGLKDGLETDVDCGGSVCNPCAKGRMCMVATDCQTDLCHSGTCLSARCTDGIQNDDETDVDCGGPICNPCANSRKCALLGDCLSNVCTGKVCAPAMITLASGPLMPATGPTTGKITVSIAGTGFLNGLKVMLGGNAASDVTVLSPIKAQFTLPAATCGQTDLTVTDPDGSTATATKAFSYFPCSTLNFAAGQFYGTGSAPRFVAVGDFNGDGKPDFATANTGSNTVSVLLNKGDGSGSFLTAQSYGGGRFPFSIAVEDFNGDGKPDLATANSYDNNVSVLLNKGDGSGSFLTAQNFATGSNPTSVAVGDFNGDGKPDLAVSNQNDSNVSVLLNKGDGSGSFLPAKNYVIGNHPASVAVGDFNGDGKPDLAVGIDLNVSVLLNKGDGSGSFLTAQSYATGSNSLLVAVGDFNGDGKSDLVTSSGGTVNVLLNKGDGSGSFLPAQNYAPGVGNYYVAVGDLNGDGKPDLAVFGYASTNMNVLLNKGDGSGSFLPAQTYGIGDTANFGAVADVNSDGKADLAIVTGGNKLGILLNTSI